MLTFVVAAVFLGWYVSTSVSNRVSSGGTFPVLADPAFSPSEIERIAQGEPADPSRPDEAVLVRAVLAAAQVRSPLDPGEHAVEVGFAPGSGRRMDIWSIGWPTPWLSRMSEPVYEDAAQRTGFTPAVTDPAAAPLPKYEMARDPLRLPPRSRWAWYGDAIQYQPPPEETGVVNTVTQIKLFAPAALAGAMILAWYSSGLFLWLVNRVRKKNKRRPAIRVRLFIVAVVGLGMVAAGVLGEKMTSAPQYTFPDLTQANFPPAPVYWTRAGYARLPWTREELEQIAGEPGADARLAAEIARLAAPTSQAGESAATPLYLAAIADCETQFQHPQSTVTYNPTLRLVGVHRIFYIRRPDFGTPEVVPASAGITLTMWQEFAVLGLSTGDASRPSYFLYIQPDVLGALIVGLWLCSWMIKLLILVLARIIRARRRARGQCQACAYPLPPSPAAPVPAA